jgi:hypothetical protein
MILQSLILWSFGLILIFKMLDFCQEQKEMFRVWIEERNHFVQSLWTESLQTSFQDEEIIPHFPKETFQKILIEGDSQTSFTLLPPEDANLINTEIFSELDDKDSFDVLMKSILEEINGENLRLLTQLEMIKSHFNHSNKPLEHSLQNCRGQNLSWCTKRLADLPEYIPIQKKSSNVELYSNAFERFLRKLMANDLLTTGHTRQIAHQSRR